MRILIVEDDRTTRRMLERLFTAQGYQVTACADGETALDYHSRDYSGAECLDV